MLRAEATAVEWVSVSMRPLRGARGSPQALLAFCVVAGVPCMHWVSVEWGWPAVPPGYPHP